MVQKSGEKTTWDGAKTLVNHGDDCRISEPSWDGAKTLVNHGDDCRISEPSTVDSFQHESWALGSTRANYPSNSERSFANHWNVRRMGPLLKKWIATVIIWFFNVEQVYAPMISFISALPNRFLNLHFATSVSISTLFLLWNHLFEGSSKHP